MTLKYHTKEEIYNAIWKNVKNRLFFQPLLKLLKLIYNIFKKRHKKPKSNFQEPWIHLND